MRTGVIEGRVLDADGEGQANATVVALPSGGLGERGSPIIWTVDSDGKFAQDRFEPGTYYLWARRGEMLVYPPEKIEISDGNLDAAHRAAASRTRGRACAGGSSPAAGRPLDPETRAVLFGQSPLALPRKAVGEIDHDGDFAVGALLPGRYEISVRVGTRVLPIIERSARGGDPDRARRHRRSPATPSSSAPRPRSDADRASPAQCRTRIRLRQSARTWWLSFSNEVKRTAIPATARLAPPCVKLMK